MIRIYAALLLGGLALSCGQAPPADAPAPAPEQPAGPVTRAVAPAPADPHWGYEGEAGPSAWGGLSPKFSACAEGKSQSPIDIAGFSSGTLPSLSASFRPASLRIAHHEHLADAINNGHTIQVNYTEGDTLAVGDESYELLQYHFHSPSEHTFEGKHFPMEMHMVHKAADGSLAVIGVFIEEGAHNAAFDPIWSNLPKDKGVENHFEGVTVNVDDLLPESRTTYRYDGIAHHPSLLGRGEVVRDDGRDPALVGSDRSVPGADPGQQPPRAASQRSVDRDRSREQRVLKPCRFT
jgi:carbonic anhydrase